ncbi:ATP-binding protein [Undibacterium sp. RTI2.1]|uniref:ATP-binding protein n=1 Tax=unclassified Undibacterium TaxID=2630295 RepID=UPI002B22ACE5|nr:MULTISPECIES: ATP-binding protein [unclassified Undibacterium]MEB0032699.1 ATP-binding protein [Undibacterium sp. RTI2.1]MEB0118660.1 ATP-binding protein [Undibacterium sp. RTI2.2]
MTNETKLYKNLKLIFVDSTKVLAELMQNARRAGAKHIRFMMSENSSNLIVEDDGVGIQNFQNLLHNSESGWDEETQLADNPFGLGFLSTLYAADEIIIESRGHQCKLIAEKVIAMEPAEVTTSDYIGHTRITLVNFKLSAEETLSAVTTYSKGFAIPVHWNDKIIDRPHAIDQLKESLALTIGIAEFNHRNPEYTQFYVQGLPIQNPLSPRTRCDNVVHLDASFTVRMPDRHALYDSEKQVDRITASIKEGWISKLHH